MPIGVKVTLRGERMYEFFDRFVSAVLPRVRDFQGVPRNAFDGQGNYTFGVKEQIVFPEIDYDKVDKVRGLQVCIVTTARTNEEAKRFLELMGIPFSRQ
jgi:large subunit ribosomal protein L5